MDTIDYWPFAQEYSIWNAAVTALQFWMVDLNSPNAQPLKGSTQPSFAAILPSI